ncbi:unnamed protein product [Diatraea saccharalis]|uniref:THAP-type domain-containing protein n=1 Tax=Diatraea saccharalis TaxID=40085 RepID=A0A9P0CAG3_9NEOP|nr:unnamed protein product [Diatraea saccharalis]
MRHDTCCVVGCKNNGKNSDKNFYRFPRVSWKQEQRMKWIIAVKRKNADGSPWYPKPHDMICSAHFIGGKKADEQDSPSYVPKIFPAIYTSTRVNENSAMSRYKRRMERSWKKEKITSNVLNIPYERNTFEIMENIDSTKIDKECQVDIFSVVENEGNTFICNRYIYILPKTYVTLKFKLK